MKLVFSLLFAIVLGVCALALLTLLDRQADRGEWDRLRSLQPTTPESFAPEMIADLPEPAKRYFT
jgi:hypothetical protein